MCISETSKIGDVDTSVLGTTVTGALMAVSDRVGGYIKWIELNQETNLNDLGYGWFRINAANLINGPSIPNSGMVIVLSKATAGATWGFQILVDCVNSGTNRGLIHYRLKSYNSGASHWGVWKTVSVS